MVVVVAVGIGFIHYYYEEYQNHHNQDLINTNITQPPSKTFGLLISHTTFRLFNHPDQSINHMDKYRKIDPILYSSRPPTTHYHTTLPHHIFTLPYPTPCNFSHPNSKCIKNTPQQIIPPPLSKSHPKWYHPTIKDQISIQILVVSSNHPITKQLSPSLLFVT